MKKYAALFVFVFSLVFSIQTTNAQDKFNANELAIKKVENLKKVLNLNNDQHKQLVVLYQAFENNKKKAAFQQSRDGVKQLKQERNLQEKLDKKLQDVLNNEQFNTLIEYRKKMLAAKAKAKMKQ